MGKSVLPPHGTVRRYRLELHKGKTCDKCRAANSQARAAERANRKARENRAGLYIADDPQEQPTKETTDPPEPPKHTDPPEPPKHTDLPRDVRVDVGRGIENAVRNYLTSSTSKPDLLAYVYGEIVIAVAKVISTAEPKDIPKLTEEMVDAAKLMKPADSGGSDDIFAGLGVAT